MHKIARNFFISQRFCDLFHSLVTISIYFAGSIGGGSAFSSAHSFSSGSSFASGSGLSGGAAIVAGPSLHEAPVHEDSGISQGLHGGAIGGGSIGGAIIGGGAIGGGAIGGGAIDGGIIGGGAIGGGPIGGGAIGGGAIGGGAIGGGGFSGAPGPLGGPDLHSNEAHYHLGHAVQRHITVVHRIGIPVPQPYQVQVERRIPVQASLKTFNILSHINRFIFIGANSC